ncbi:MAG: hypothetical protein JW755_04410 [Candidatus Aminicenantes bacterium]|nr:hypothetical protein [Candidatus Aminicenantes bacterium]
MIRKVYAADPLLCSSCGGRMRIISFIEEPKTIDRIIRLSRESSALQTMPLPPRPSFSSMRSG